MSEWRPDATGPARQVWVPDPDAAPAAPGPALSGQVPPQQAAPQPEVPGGSLPPSRTSRQHREPARSSGPLAWLRETAIVLVSALVLSLLVKTFLVQAFWIPSQSMHDTLIEDDRILVSKLTPGPFQVHRGDIVVFKDPGGWLNGSELTPETEGQHILNDVLTFVGLRPVDAGQHLVKRVIGLPGDRVACAGSGQPITVNGVAIDEPYLAPGSVPSTFAFDVTVPEDSLWVMGDNRAHSQDSRYHLGDAGGGSIPMANVVGVAFVVVWPADRWTVLHNPGATFADVPDPA